ncbi:MAG: DUF4858 domain-containing protein [Tannerellaceae bacterium]|jgi:hypothetical protein|nr:DUF4858 domain-containing protein [Tannerellaceae bacterium]
METRRKTRRNTIILLFCCLQNTALIYAQWTKEDSVWLDKVLSGKETIKLTPEFQQAIESGTFLNTDIQSPSKQMKIAPGRIPINKDFTEYLSPGKLLKDIEEARDVDPFSIPPAVFMRYGPAISLPENKAGNAFVMPGHIKENAARPSGRSFDDALRSIFSPSFRARERNRNNANAWKTYNDYW